MFSIVASGLEYLSIEKGAQGFCKKAKPESIIDISAITSIYRPGPLSAKVHNHYVKAKRNPMSESICIPW